MKYQHPELEQVRRVLNGTNSRLDSGEVSNGTFYGTVTKHLVGSAGLEPATSCL